jgi:hypothetical protein
MSDLLGEGDERRIMPAEAVELHYLRAGISASG